jgi:hypothetical protein
MEIFMSTDTRVSFGSMAVLVEAVESNAELNGVLPFEFTGGEIVNVVLFSRSTTRVVTPLNARSFKMLAETSKLCTSLETLRSSRSSNEVGRFTVAGSLPQVTVFGFPYELTAEAGQITLCNIPSAGVSYRNYFQERFDESTGKSFIPIILHAAHFSGDTRFKVGDVIYQVVGLWDSFENFTSGSELPPDEGGGGVTIIPDGGTLEGTYQGSVICEGEVTITGGLLVQGSLNTKAGNCIINTLGQGNDIIVQGDWISSQVSSNMGGIISSNIRIYGDWIFSSVSLVRNEGFLYILGDVIQDIETYGEGGHFHVYTANGIDGGYIVVGGDLIVQQLQAVGGAQDLSSGNAGNGSSLLVMGSINSGTIYLYGGHITDDVEGVSSPEAGSGGTIDCKGSISCGYLELYGGSCSVIGEGGNGGTILCGGHLISDYISLNGANSYVSRAGNGGVLEVNGIASVRNTINLAGGYSYPTDEDPAGPGGSAGSCYFFGGGSVGYLQLTDGGGVAPIEDAGLEFSGTLNAGVIDLSARSNVYIVAEPGSTLRVNSMPTKAAVHHIDIENGLHVESANINNFLMGSIFLSTGTNTEWMIISGIPISSIP